MAPTELEVLRDRLLAAVYRDVAPLELSAFCVRGEPVAYEQAVRGEYEPFKVGDPWGPPWSTTWFHVQGTVPVDWARHKAVAVFDLGFAGSTGFTCEALAWKDGKPWCGVDPNHTWLQISGHEVDFYLEAAANPTATVSGPDPAPSMIALRASLEPAFTLRRAELRIQDRRLLKTALDFKVLVELIDSLPEGERRAEILRALDRFAHSYDPDALSEVLSKPTTSAHVISAIGHAHIDTAWLWPLRESQRKVARSWSTQLALMDEHPDYVFAASQPAQYAWMKESYPDVYSRLKEQVAAGRWEPVGAMWVEADCNLPSGESLVRQLLHGKRFFMREFGYETRILWLPDVFGYPGNLPQLISEAGCDFFLTQKLSWNDTNKPDHHTFWWEGIDGTRVFTHFPPADTYNGDFSAGEVIRSARNFKDAASSNRSLYLFGYGDGGGGPTAEMIESAHLLGVPMGKAIDFFDRSSSDAQDLATVRGELYFELHRGTYTSQARTKQLNRRAQDALREAEMWSVAAGGAYPREELEAAWKRLLLNQFHDILPGSSIDWVYEDAERELSEVALTANWLTDKALTAIRGQGPNVIRFNPSSHPRAGAPGCGWAVVEDPPAADYDSLENEFLRIELGDDGVIASIWDKEAGREVLSGPGNVFELHHDNPKRWDAWDVDIEHRDSFVKVGSRFGRSWINQQISLNGRVLRFDSEIDWRERHKLLKVAFPVTVRADVATYEVQFGHVRRPTHMNTPQARAMFEVCAQRWADLGDGDYGVALLNDCKHGYDIHDGVMRLSLMRAPTHPDPNADQGLHMFTYALMPHIGDLRAAGVIEAAEDLYSLLRTLRTNLPVGTSRSLVEVDTRQVIVEAIKRAEDSDAVIVRLYEAWGRPCRARIKTTLPASRAFLCDLLERDREEVAVRDGVIELELTRFKILTLKLVP